MESSTERHRSGCNVLQSGCSGRLDMPALHPCQPKCTVLAPSKASKVVVSALPFCQLHSQEPLAACTVMLSSWRASVYLSSSKAEANLRLSLVQEELQLGTQWAWMRSWEELNAALRVWSELCATISAALRELS